MKSQQRGAPIPNARPERERPPSNGHIGNAERMARLGIESGNGQPGGLRITTSSSVESTAPGAGFTAGILRWMEEQPEVSLGEVLDEVGTLAVRDVGSKSLSATPTTPADVTLREETGGDGKKLAAYVGNAAYRSPWPALSAVPGEVNGLESQLSRRGYETAGKSIDVNAPDMMRTFEQASGVGEGDSVVLYFGGHGEPEGLIGVEDEASGLRECGEDNDDSVCVEGPMKSPVVTRYPTVEPEAWWDPGIDEAMPGSGERDRLPLGVIRGLANRMSNAGADVHLILDACFVGNIVAPEGGGAFHELATDAYGAEPADIRKIGKKLYGLRRHMQHTSEQVKHEAELTMSSSELDSAKEQLQSFEEALEPDEERRSALDIKEIMNEASPLELAELAQVRARLEEAVPERAALEQAVTDAAAELDASIQQAVGRVLIEKWPPVLRSYQEISDQASTELGVTLPQLPARILGYHDFMNAVSHMRAVATILTRSIRDNAPLENATE